jgi:monofunctional biosynthetic peptidoglycan transglycosylase
LKRSDMILRLMKKKGILTAEEYRLALSQQPNIGGMQKKVDEAIVKEVVPEDVFANMTSAVILSPEAPENGNEENAQTEETPAPFSPDEVPAPESQDVPAESHKPEAR